MKSYYMLTFDVDSHYEESLTAISTTPAILVDVLKAKLSQNHALGTLVPEPAEIILSRIENDNDKTFETAEEYSLIPYIEIFFKNINHKYWHWDKETDDEKEYRFPKELLITFDLFGEMSVWSSERKPLKIEGVDNPNNIPLKVGEFTPLEEILDTLWAKANTYDDFLFDEWDARIFIGEEVKKLLSPLEGTPISDGNNSYYGKIGVSENGEEPEHLKEYAGNIEANRCEIIEKLFQRES